MRLSPRVRNVRPGSARSFGGTFGAHYGLDLVLAPVVLPLQRLEIAQVVTAALGAGKDMVNFPAVAAPGIAEVLAHDGPAPGIHARVRVSPQSPRLLPDGLNDFRAESPSVGVRLEKGAEPGNSHE